MKDEFSHIFESSEHIDESRLWLYANGKLSRDEIHEIEKHLVDCQMCSDIVEGFSLYSSEGSFNASRNRATEAFFSKNRKNRKLIIRRLSVAAAFLLLAGSSYVLVKQLDRTKKSEPQFVLETTKRPETEPDAIGLTADTTDRIAMNSRQGKTAEEEPLNEQKRDGNTEQSEKTSVAEELNVVADYKEADPETVDPDYVMEIDEFEEASIDNEMATGAVNKNVPVLDSGSEDKVVSRVEIADESNITESLSADNKFEKTGEISDVQTVSESKDSGSKLFDHRNRARYSSTDKSDFPSSAEAGQAKTDLFSSGMDSYHNANYREAINILLQISRDDDAYWDAHWVIAASYLELQEKAKAIDQYHLLQDTVSPYRYSAGEKLQELGE